MNGEEVDRTIEFAVLRHPASVAPRVVEATRLRLRSISSGRPTVGNPVTLDRHTQAER